MRMGRHGRPAMRMAFAACNAAMASGSRQNCAKEHVQRMRGVYGIHSQMTLVVGLILLTAQAGLVRSGGPGNLISLHRGCAFRSAMELSVALVVLAACTAGAATLPFAPFVPFSVPSPAPPNPAVSAKMYADSIGPVIDYIATGTPPTVKVPFYRLLGPFGPLPNLREQSVVLKWHELLLAAVRAFTGVKPYSSYPTAVARALFIVQTSVFDAWAAYDKEAVGVYWPASGFRRPAKEGTAKNKAEAASFAAYQAIINLFPGAEAPLLGYLKDTTPSFSNDMLTCTDTSVAACLGNSAAFAVLSARKDDKSNQEGNYRDYSNFDYPDPRNYSAWQRLSNDKDMQYASTPFWRNVTSFALKRSNQFVPPPSTTFLYDEGPSVENYRLQAAAVLAYSTDLDDRTKVIGDYWADFGGSNLPPGHWTQYAEWVLSTAPKGKYTLDDEIKLLFALSAALLDASISAWDTKYQYVAVRPITAITKAVYNNTYIAAWKRNNSQSMTPAVIKGDVWEPFQPPGLQVTPPFPAFVSGHSTFGGAFETVLAQFTKSDRFGLEIVVPANYTFTEPPNPKYPNRKVPANDTILYYPTFSYSSQENGISRLYNGVHFANDNICGRAQGIAAGLQAYRAYEGLLAGKCIEKSKDDPEQAYVREQFELYMEPAMKTPAMDQKVRLQIVA